MKKECDLFQTLDNNGCLIKDLVGQPFILAYHKRCGHVYTIEKINGTIIETLDVSSMEFTIDDFERLASTRFFNNLNLQESRQASPKELETIKGILLSGYYLQSKTTL